MSTATVLPGETPFEWADRILARYEPVVVTVPRCGYCGSRTAGPAACRAHRDLLLIDPFYTAEPAALPLEESAAGSNRNGG